MNQSESWDNLPAFEKIKKKKKSDEGGKKKEKKKKKKRVPTQKHEFLSEKED